MAPFVHSYEPTANFAASGPGPVSCPCCTGSLEWVFLAVWTSVRITVLKLVWEGNGDVASACFWFSSSAYVTRLQPVWLWGELQTNSHRGGTDSGRSPNSLLIRRQKAREHWRQEREGISIGADNRTVILILNNVFKLQSGTHNVCFLVSFASSYLGYNVSLDLVQRRFAQV